MAINDIKTIDNLPLTSSIQFEESKAQIDVKLLSDSEEVSATVGLDNFSASLHSSVSLLFNLDKDLTSISPPPGFNEQSGRLFKNQVAPNLGPEDKLETAAQRIEGAKNEYSSSDISAKNSVENQAGILQSLLTTVTDINKSIEYANGERARFQKG
jgi:hypothetical protein